MKKYIYADEKYRVILNGVEFELPVNATMKSGVCVQALDSMFGQYMAMLTHYDKVAMIRTDIKMHDYTGKNTELSNFIDDFKDEVRRVYKAKAKKLNSKKKKGERKVNYDLKNIGVMWCREYEKAENKNQHYHLVLLFDGHVVQSVWTISQIIKRMNNSLARYHIFKSHRMANKVQMIERDNPESFNDAFYWASYIAKERGKGYRDKTANDYSVSRIKPNMDKIELVARRFNRPIFELTLCEPKQPQIKRLTKRTTTRRCTKAVNDAQLDLFDNVA